MSIGLSIITNNYENCPFVCSVWVKCGLCDKNSQNVQRFDSGGTRSSFGSSQIKSTEIIKSN